MAERPSRAYSRLFLYGGVGMGKTHLMHAIGHEVKRRQPVASICYVSAEKFTNEMITSLRNDRMTSFRDRFRSVDVLLIDDIEFIAQKERTQEEFFHTFNALHEKHQANRDRLGTVRPRSWRRLRTVWYAAGRERAARQRRGAPRRLSAKPMVAILARYASRFTVRAVDLAVDSSALWVGAGLAIVAAVLLAFIPRLPSSSASESIAIAGGGVRITGSTNRRLRLFAVTQIAASFVLLAGASTLLKTLLDLQRSHPTFDTQHVLVVDVPVDAYGKTQAQIVDFYKDAQRRVAQVPGVVTVAVGDVVPWRDNENYFELQFAGEGHVQGSDQDNPRAEYRPISPGNFATLGVPIVQGRDFTDLDGDSLDAVVIISKAVADRVFPGQDPINHHVWWTDPVIQFAGIRPTPRRIVGVVGNVDDVHILPEPTLAIYEPIARVGLFGGRLFVRASGNPYALVSPITRVIEPCPPTSRSSTRPRSRM